MLSTKLRKHHLTQPVNKTLYKILKNVVTRMMYMNNAFLDSPWKPKKYLGPNMFVPRNEYEETILLLLISEAMAVRDAVLSQSPEFKEARIHAFENATAVYDLLAVVVVRWSQVDLLYEVDTIK